MTLVKRDLSGVVRRAEPDPSSY